MKILFILVIRKFFKCEIKECLFLKRKRYLNITESGFLLLTDNLPKLQLIGGMGKRLAMMWLSELDGVRLGGNQERRCRANGGLTGNPTARL